jgi:hypothetical protein
MDSDRFDGLSRSVSALLSRRSLAGILGVAALTAPGVVAAKKHKKHKKKKKAKFNDFGCVNVGDFCKNSGQCCSGVCTGSKCQAHNASTCQPGQDVCLGTGPLCDTDTGDLGECSITTGQASYCEAIGDCFACKKDADCVAVCGEGAACIVCEAECTATGGTACVGPSADSCDFGP